jgi:hypothetical protein
MDVLHRIDQRELLCVLEVMLEECVPRLLLLGPSFRSLGCASYRLVRDRGESLRFWP